jgi:hypothetical protein
VLRGPPAERLVDGHLEGVIVAGIGKADDVDYFALRVKAH